MKPLTRILAILLALALLSSCTPATDTAPSQGSGSLQSSDPDALASQPPERLSSEPAASSDDDAAPSPATPTAPPEGTASDEAGASTSAATDPHAEHETAILAALENIDPASFLWMSDRFIVRDDAGVEYLGHLLGEYEQELHAAEYPGAEVPLFTVDAFTDENGAWRSGEHGSGVDAETAEHLISGAIRLFSFSGNLPVAGSEFTGEGLVIATLPITSPFYEDAQAYLLYLEAVTPDAEAFDPPMQMFVYYLTHSQGNEGGYYAYNEGYGWSTLDG